MASVLKDKQPEDLTISLPSLPSTKRKASAETSADDWTGIESIPECVCIHNKFLPENRTKLSKPNESASNGFYNLRKYCFLCNKRTLYHCRACSVSEGKCINICQPEMGSMDECWSNHIANTRQKIKK